jgi:PAS domain S-box-containing protein
MPSNTSEEGPRGETMSPAHAAGRTPVSFPSTDMIADRRVLLEIGMAAVFLACIVFTAARLLITLRTGKLTPWWIDAMSAVAIAALYLWYRRTPESRSPVAANGTALAATLALLVPVAYGMSSSVWWLGLVGFAMVMLGRRNEAFVWGVLIPVLVVGTVLVEPWVQLEGAAGEPPLEHTLAKVVFVVLLVGMAAAFRRAAEKRAVALHDSEQRYRTLFQRAPVGVFQCDSRRRVTDCNDRAAEILGKTREHLIGRDLRSLSDDRPVAAIEDALEGVQGSYDGPYLRSDGSEESFVSIRTVPLVGGDGRVRGALGIAGDVTERVRMERELLRSHDELEHRVRERTAELQQSRSVIENILNSVPQAVFWKDRQSVYLGCNQVFSRGAGLADPADIIGHTDFELPWRDRADAYRADDREVMETGRPKRDIVEPVAQADGAVLWARTSKIPLVGERGEIYGVLGVFEDITERKRSEEALRESEQKFSAAFHASPDLMAITRLSDGRILEVNEAYCGLLGHSREESIGKTTSELSIWVDPADRLSLVTSLQARGQLDDFEVRLRCKSGRILECLDSARTISLEGQPCMLSAVHDITARKAAEDALRASEERYRLITTNTSDGIFTLDLGGTVTFASPNLLAAGGYSEADVVGRPMTDFVPAESRAHVRDKFVRSMRGEHIPDYEIEVLGADGSRRPIEISMSHLTDAQGTIVGRVGVLRDITERKRLEEEMRRSAQAIEQVGEAIVITDPAGTIEYVNPAFTRITGYSREEAIGENPRILNSGNQQPEFYGQMWATLARGDAWHGHFINRRKDGSLYEADATIAPVRRESGEVLHYVAVQRDVTEEMGLQAQLRQAQKMEAIGGLAGGIAHDFNNLLQAILSHIQLFRMDPRSREVELADLEALVERGAGLARQLLLFSRPETTRRELMDLNDVVRNSGKLLRRLLRENVELVVALGGGPLTVEADPGQIGQVLMNLAVNAADAMATGGRLTIRTGRDGPEVWLEAEDAGVGIPAEIRERIFEPFFTTKAPGHGTGLGLSVVHGIVASHGGRVELQSEVGTGTRIRVVLPEKAGPAGPRAVPPASAALPAGHGERVLVVEDEVAARQGLAEILVMLGYEVITVGSGESAGLLPDDPPFDVLLTDLMLPDVDGAALAQGLIDRWPKLKVIIMSGYGEDEALRHARELGPVVFLQKPFDIGTLARELRAALEG